MNITFVSHHCCIRVQKQAIALKCKGHKVRSISYRKPDFKQIFDSVSIVSKGKFNQFRDLVKMYDSVTDVYYVHTEPYWLVILIREISDKPILLDCHDSMLWRLPDDTRGRSAEERVVIEMVDGLVFPSERCQEITNDYYKISKSSQKNQVVLYPYVNERFIIYSPWQWIGGLVYEGRVDKKSAPRFMDYCKYHEVADQCKKLKLPFHMYSPWKDNNHLKEYSNVNTYPGQEYTKLLTFLGCHDWGLIGNVTKHHEWDVAMPNKLFEYMAAGIPSVVINAKLAGEFVEKHGIGIVVSDLKELKKRWDERKQLQKHVLKVRNQFTMEKHIDEVERLCQKLI